jgi:hypothetical protein
VKIREKGVKIKFSLKKYIHSGGPSGVFHLKHRVRKRQCFFDTKMTSMNPSQHYPDQDGQKPNVESVAPEARFQASGYKDVWAAILFLIATAAFGFVSYFGITFLRIRLNNTQGLSFTGTELVLIPLGIAIACGSIFGLGFYLLFAVFAKFGVLWKALSVPLFAYVLALAIFVYRGWWERLYIGIVCLMLTAACYWDYRKLRRKIVFYSNQANFKVGVEIHYSNITKVL